MSTVKAMILDRFPQFSPIKKVADVQAELDGHMIRIIIKKDEVQHIKRDQKVVWSHQDGAVLDYISSLIPKPKVAKKSTNSRISVTPEWIAHLESVAQQVPLLREGHNIKMRVATSHGKPVTACIDIHEGEKKLASGGRPYKVNFATNGIDADWMTRVNKATEIAYQKIDKKKK